MIFDLQSPFSPAGDQARAIKQLITQMKDKSVRSNTLLGVTGSGKTFTMANVIKELNRPTLVLSHNKTLVAQLYSELRDFFPNNAVEYFVSYYDYYQPEAYVPQTDTFIEKDSSINDDIDRLRLRATSSLLSRNDCIVVSSVSCIYGLGTPEDYMKMLLFVKINEDKTRDQFIQDLVGIQYDRNDIAFKRGTFRVKGDTVDVYLAYEEKGVRIKWDWDLVVSIEIMNPVSQEVLQTLDQIAIYPAKHFVTTEDRIEQCIPRIERDLEKRLAEFRMSHKLLEAQRLEQRTRYDIEMMRELGYCSGIENYSLYLTGRNPGSRPYCLLDYFPDDYLIIIDESHVTIPQIKGMYNGDQARKQTLVEHGFRLPSAKDNRPLMFEEFEKLVPQVLYVSATPGEYELNTSSKPIEQIIRPTGLLDPKVTIHPTQGQIEHLIEQIEESAKRNQRVLVTTLTKKMAEDLTRFLKDRGVRSKYLHSEIDAIDRVQILKSLRENDFDCLVGINLLREGLDLPEVSLVAILDADKEGFLRSKTSLIQTAGRAARHEEGRVILYADSITKSMKEMMDETARRRLMQKDFNQKNNIIPQSINKKITMGIEEIRKTREIVEEAAGFEKDESNTIDMLDALEIQMEEAARNLQFEKAIGIRDKIDLLRREHRTRSSHKKSFKVTKKSKNKR